LIVANGRFKHQTGDGSDGCFGFDKTDRIKEVSVSSPGTSYTLFRKSGCKGAVVATGKDTTTFKPAIKFGSVKLTCPEPCIPDGSGPCDLTNFRNCCSQICCLDILGPPVNKCGGC